MEIEFLSGEVLTFANKDFDMMKQRAKENCFGKFRYCFHQNEQANMQEMMFVQGRNVYSRPHKHEEFAETQMIMDGEGVVVIFGDEGEVRHSFRIGKKGIKFWRIQKNIYHMLITLSEQIVVYEVREGQFNINSNTFPAWAPLEKETKTAQNFITHILEISGGE